jgi:hypothetical protein
MEVAEPTKKPLDHVPRYHLHNDSRKESTINNLGYGGHGFSTEGNKDNKDSE